MIDNPSPAVVAVSLRNPDIPGQILSRSPSPTGPYMEGRRDIETILPDETCDNIFVTLCT